jgi:hypothetical protein
MREILGDDVVMAGPNPFNGQSRVLKIDGTSKYFNDALSEDDKYILCGGHHMSGDTGGSADVSKYPRKRLE